MKIVGYLDFATAKVYKTKAAMLAAKTRKAAKQIVKTANSFADDFANVLKSQALSDKICKAKKLLAAKWTFSRYCDLLTCLRLIKAFNKEVDSLLRVYY